MSERFFNWRLRRKLRRKGYPIRVMLDPSNYPPEFRAWLEAFVRQDTKQSP